MCNYQVDALFNVLKLFNVNNIITTYTIALNRGVLVCVDSMQISKIIIRFTPLFALFAGIEFLINFSLRKDAKLSQSRKIFIILSLICRLNRAEIWHIGLRIDFMVRH